MRLNSDQPVFFLKNQQGDIKFIADANGSTLNEYVYDAWGNHKVYKYINGTILTDSSGNPIDIRHNPDYTNDIGNINPFRYRSYYFDSETGWYYLNSRYYDPQARRFLIADDPSIPSDQATIFGGLNLYSYCLNNPVNMVDPSGKSIFVGIILGLLISVGVEFLGDYLDDGTINRNLSSYIGAGISGLIGGMGTSLISTMLFAGIGNVVGGLIAQDFSNPNQAVLAFFLGALAGGVSYGIGKGIQASLAKGKYYKIIGKASENIVINKRLANAGIKGVKIGKDGIDAVLEVIIGNNPLYSASKDFFSNLFDFGFGTAGELLGF